MTGEDAVLLVGTKDYGHLGALIQDENGKWWHFYWGAANHDNSFEASATIFCPAAVSTTCIEYSGTISLDGVNAHGLYSDYSDMLYLTGDFSASVNYAKNPGNKYNALFNNCSQVTLRILSKSDTAYKTVFQDASKIVFPAKAFKKVNNQVSKSGSRSSSTANLIRGGRARCVAK